MQNTKTLTLKNEQNHIDTRFLLSCFLVLLPYCTLIFSAPLTFFFSLAIMFFLSFLSPSKYLRYALAFCVLLAASLTFGDLHNNDDNAEYYRVFIEMSRGDYALLNNFGFEKVAPLYWAFLGLVFGELSPTAFCMINVFSVALAFYIWLEKYELSALDSKNACLCAFLVLLLVMYWQNVHAARQSFSTIFILYAVVQKRFLPALIFSALAFFSHTTALIFLPIMYCLKYRPKLGIAMILFLCLALATSSFFLYFGLLPSWISNKAIFYDLVNFVTHYPIFAVLFIVLIVSAVIFKDDVPKNWYYFIVFYALYLLCAYFVFTHLMARTGFIYLNFLVGLFIFLIYKNHKTLLYGACVLIFFMQIYMLFGFLYQDEGKGMMDAYGLGGSWFYFLLD